MIGLSVEDEPPEWRTCSTCARGVVEAEEDDLDEEEEEPMKFWSTSFSPAALHWSKRFYGLRRLVLWNLFSLESKSSSTATDHLLSSLRDRFMHAILPCQGAATPPMSLSEHFAFCAVEMLTIIFCISLLRYLTGFSLFTAPVCYDDEDDEDERGIKGDVARGGRPQGSSEKSIRQESGVSSSGYSENEGDFSDGWELEVPERQIRLSVSTASSLSRNASHSACEGEIDSQSEEEEDDDGEEEVERSSIGNYSFNSNHVEISTCYNESEDDSGDDRGKANLLNVFGKGGGSLRGDKICRSHSLGKVTSTSALTAPAAAALLASLKQRQQLSQVKQATLPDFPSPICDDVAREDVREKARSSSSSSSSSSSASSSATSRCSWFNEHYGSIYEAERGRRLPAHR